MSDIDDAKKVAFYSESLSAWYTTKLEKDKHLLSLSSAAIALLVTLATTVGVHDVKVGVVYCIALLAFLVCIVSVLAVLDNNAEYLKSIVIKSELVKSQNSKLLGFDKISSNSFIIGILFTLLVGLFSALDSNKIEIQQMTDKDKKIEQTNQSKIESTGGLNTNSLAGAHEMDPSATLDDSTPSEKEEPKKEAD